MKWDILRRRSVAAHNRHGCEVSPLDMGDTDILICDIVCPEELLVNGVGAADEGVLLRTIDMGCEVLCLATPFLTVFYVLHLA